MALLLILQKLLIVLLFLGHGFDDNTVRAGSVTMAVSVGIHASGKYACCPGSCHRGPGTEPELNSSFSAAALLLIPPSGFFGDQTFLPTAQ